MTMEIEQKYLTAKQRETLAVHDALWRITCEQASGLYSERVTRYLNTCRPGEFDVRDTMGAENMEFLQMAWYSMTGALPDGQVMSRWESRAGEPGETFRRAVLETLTALPEVTAKGISVRNNIYRADDADAVSQRQSLKQRILFGGYQLSRRLPLSVKVPLKKAAMKLFFRS